MNYLFWDKGDGFGAKRLAIHAIHAGTHTKKGNKKEMKIITDYTRI